MLYARNILFIKMCVMNISVFDVIGPIMIGPSSSHTAGAARLARAARIIAGEKPLKVSFGLHGSFAKTCKGHGTDRALVAGILGIKEDDERLKGSFDIAKSQNIEYEFYKIEIADAHENTVKITFFYGDGSTCEVIGSSVGGGKISITNINGFESKIDFQNPTMVIFQKDEKGIISEISSVLLSNNLNIAQMYLIRKTKGETACCVIETDDDIPTETVEQLLKFKGILNAEILEKI